MTCDFFFFKLEEKITKTDVQIKGVNIMVEVNRKIFNNKQKQLFANTCS